MLRLLTIIRPYRRMPCSAGRNCYDCGSRCTAWLIPMMVLTLGWAQSGDADGLADAQDLGLRSYRVLPLSFLNTFIALSWIYRLGQMMDYCRYLLRIKPAVAR
jgi:hypothetical protein